MCCKECGGKKHTSKTCLSKYKDIMRTETNVECSICLSKVNKPKCKTSCGHIFHITCLKQWLKSNVTCPNCRKSINNNKEEVLIILIDAIIERIDEIDDNYLLASPNMVEDVIESYFENEILI
jgi:hypothetical protein